MKLDNNKHKNKRNKKSAVFSAQFNWVFVLIIGVIIFLFFITISKNYKNTEESKITIETQNTLKQIFSGQTSLEEGTSVITLTTPTEINSKDIKEIAFLPKNIKSTTFVLQTKPINKPFWVDNALFITTPNIIYIFISEEENDEIEQLYDEMPDRFIRGENGETILACNKFLIYWSNSDEVINKIETITKDLSQKNRVVLVSNSISDLNNPNIKINLTEVLMNDNLNSLAEKLGWIYCEGDLICFDEVENRINQRYESVKKIYIEKSRLLYNLVNNQNCKNIYILYIDPTSGYNDLTTLITQNQQLQYLSCPVIY